MPDFSKDDRGQTDITAPVELLADEVEAVVGGNGGIARHPDARRPGTFIL